MKKAGIIIFMILLASAAALYGRPLLWRQKTNQPVPPKSASRYENIDYTSQVLQNFNPSLAPKELAANQVPVAAVTSHHIPMAETFIDQMYRQLQLARPDISTFVIVGPDHFERCNAEISTTNKNFLTPFGLIENDQNITKAFIKAGIKEGGECFGQEHAIGVQASFIKKYFPKAKASAILLSSAVTTEQAAKLAGTLAEADLNAVVICSTDFSHYQSIAVANKIDEGTGRQLNEMSVTDIKLEQIDSPASINFTVTYAKISQAQTAYIKHANSFEFSGAPDNTTSYFDVIFAK